MPYIGQPPVTGDTTKSFRLLDNIASYTLTFNATSASVVSTTNDTLTFNQHRFVTAQRVTYNNGGGTAIGGLTSGTAYFIIKIDQNTIKLATSAANANAGTAIDLTAGAVGTSHTLNVAFDNVNTKFKATYNDGTKASLARAGQLLISVNGVIQQPQESSSPTLGFGLEPDATIVFAVAPASTDSVFGQVLADTITNFDITDNTVDNFTGNGSTTAFTLSKNVPNNQNVLVTLDGVVQYPSDTITRAYSVLNNVLTFVSAPGNGVEIQVRHIGYAGATSSSVTGFYGRTGNVGLTTADNVTVGIVTVSGITVVSAGTTAAPSITPVNDNNTGIFFPSADTIAFGEGGAEAARFDSSGRLLVGTSSARVIGNAGSFNSSLQVETTTYAGLSIVNNSNDATGALFAIGKSRGTTVGSSTIVQSGDTLGDIRFAGADGTVLTGSFASIAAQVDTTPGVNDYPGRLVFSTTADGASSPTERMRITNDGVVLIGTTSTATGGSGGNFAFIAQCFTNEENRPIAAFRRNDLITAQIFGSNGGDGNAANCSMRIRSNNGTGRSINAGGTVNAAGADYAEYMTKAGDFVIAKGDICGVTSNGELTKDFADSVGFVVKSTNPSYVGGDIWGDENVVGVEPDADDADALAQWEANLEAARQKVDRIAFAGQVPVNVMGATPGQYIVPVEAADGGIEGIAKNEGDLTLAEYMRTVGKVIAIEDDGRARIIVKVV